MFQNQFTTNFPSFIFAPITSLVSSAFVSNILKLYGHELDLYRCKKSLDSQQVYSKHTDRSVARRRVCKLSGWLQNLLRQKQDFVCSQMYLGVYFYLPASQKTNATSGFYRKRSSQLTSGLCETDKFSFTSFRVVLSRKLAKQFCGSGSGKLNSRIF